MLSASLKCCLPPRFVCSQDECLTVQYRDGRLERLPGPRELWFKWTEHEAVRVEPIERHAASDAQAISILYLDGRLERRPGPAQIQVDPFVHQRVRVEPLVRHVADANQYMLVQARDGTKSLTRGPCELTFDPAVHERVEVTRIERHIADGHEYLSVQYRDGRREHLPGPVELCFNPFEHESVRTLKATRLAANEALVVYRRLSGGAGPTVAAKAAVPAEKGSAAIAGQTVTAQAAVPAEKGLPTNAPTAALPSGVREAQAEAAVGSAPAAQAKTAVSALAASQHDGTGALRVGSAAWDAGAVRVERRVVHGPAVFMPGSNEWLHEFSWHGSIRDGKGSKTGYSGDEKVPHALNFNVLRCMPDQIYYSVREVRTMDDAHLTVHLMLFYELRHIETMLDSTNDLIGDILSAASADVVTFGAANTYEGFLSRTAELSKLESFPILASRMAQTGTALLKVVYRGYTTSAQLQDMHEQAIARRTKIRLESDAAREEQEKMAMELRCREERSVKEQQLEEKTTRHKLAMEALMKKEKRDQAEAENKLRLKDATEASKTELAHARAIHDEELRRAREQAADEIRQLEMRYEAEKLRLEALANLKVDLTKYLCASVAVKPDHHLRIESDAATPNVHLHPAGVTSSSK